MALLHAVTSAAAVLSVAASGVELRVADKMKILGFVLDRRLTFQKHVMIVARSCHYHAQAIRHNATYCQRRWHRLWRAS